MRGATVRSEALQGKGHVVRRMFADVEADIYLLVDGDDTYDPAAAPAMMPPPDRAPARHGHRDPAADGQDAYRRGHRIGNRLLTLS